MAINSASDMTDPWQKRIFSSYKPWESCASDLSQTQKDALQQRSLELADVLTKLDAALATNNLGGLKLSSGWRPTSVQRDLYNKNSKNGT